MSDELAWMFLNFFLHLIDFLSLKSGWKTGQASIGLEWEIFLSFQFLIKRVAFGCCHWECQTVTIRFLSPLEEPLLRRNFWSGVRDRTGW